MAGYSARQSTFTTGDTITAAHSNNEFNAILAAFHVSTGHKHDGSTAGDGGPISTLFSNAISMGTGADTDIAVTFNANSNDGVITWMEDEDYFQFSDDLLISGTEKIQFRDTALYINSSTDGQLDLVADTKIQLTATTIGLDGAISGTGVADEDDMSSNSATKLATQQSIKAYVDSQVTAQDLDFQGDSGGALSIDLDSESLTIAGGTGVTTTGSSNTVTVAVDAAQTGITSLLATDIKIGEDNETKIDFETADEIHFYAANAEQVYVADGVFGPQTDSDVDLGTTGVRWKDAYIDTVTTTGNVTVGGDLTISGDDLTMATNTAGNLLIADGTNYNPTAVGDLSEISTVANDDVLLALDTSGGGLKKITRSTLVAGLTAGTEISNLVEDTSPQLGGDLDVNGNGLVSTSNGNIALTPNGSGVVRIDGSNGIDMESGAISIKNSGSQSYVRFYCEVSNAHYAQLQAPAHSDFSGNITLTLPATTDTLVGKTTTDTLTNKTLTTPVIAEIDSGSTITLDATTDIILDADGGDIFFKDAGTTFGSATNTSGNLILKSGTTTALTFSGANATAAGNLIVTGDLTVNGTTTTVNSTTVTIDDPIFTLGGDSAPGSDDNKDRGIEFRYHNGSAAKVGFFGYDDSAGAFTFIPDATNSSEVFSGTAGNVVFGNIAGTLTTAAQTNITSVGALDGGSISSNFGAIDVGSSAITTTGTVTGGTLAGTLSTAAQTNITSTGALDGGSITSGFGAIDNGTSGIRTNTFTAETSIVPDASGGADLGTTSLEWGDLYIADDKKIYLGSDQDVSIEYDEDGNDTTAVVAAGGVSMAPHGTSTGNTTELRFQELAANGANYVGFKGPDAIASNEVWTLPNTDGTSGQFLTTDGSNALSWANAGGGGITATASGAIAAGKALILNANGTVSQATGTSTNYYQSSTTRTNESWSGTASTGNTIDVDFYGRIRVAYKEGTEIWVTIYQDDSDGDADTEELKAFASKYDGAISGSDNASDITRGSVITLESDMTSGGAYGVYYDEDNDYFVAVYNANSSGSYVAKACILTLSGTDGVTLTKGTEATDTGLFQNNGGSGRFEVVYDTTNNVGIIVAPSNNNKAAFVTCSGTSISLSSSYTSTSWDSNGGTANNDFIGVGYDKINNRVMVLWTDDSNSNYPTINSFRKNGSDISVGTNTQLSSYSGPNAFGWAIPNRDIHSDNTDPPMYTYYGYRQDLSATWISVGTVTNMDSTLSLSKNGEYTVGSAPIFSFGASNERGQGWCRYNQASKVMGAYYPHQTTTNTWLFCPTTYGSGTSTDRYQWDNSNEITMATDGYSGGIRVDNPTIFATGDQKGQFVITGRSVSSSSTYNGKLFQQVVRPAHDITVSSTNLTYRNFIGISKEAVSDGASVGIAGQGSSTDAVSGLTAGSTYFVDPYSNGDLVTSISNKYPRVVAGKALTTGSIAVGRDVSGYTSMPEDTTRIFCGSYDFRRQGGGDDANVLISLPAGFNPKDVRAYDIQWYGIGFSANDGYMKIKAYNGTSNVMTGNWYGRRMTEGDSHTDNATIDSNGLLTGYSFDGVYQNHSGRERQTVGIDTPYVYLLTGRGTYVNAKKNPTWEYEGTYRNATSNTAIIHEKGIAGGAGSFNSTDYTDGFYFYASAGTNFVEGVVTVYAIMNTDATIDHG